MSHLGSRQVDSIWKASTELAESPDWETGGSTSFRYVFDSTLHSQLLGAGWAGFLEGVKLAVYVGETPLAVKEGLASILGVATVDQPTYDGVVLEFDYDPSMGALKLEWSVGAILHGTNLGSMSLGTHTLLAVTDARIEVDVIPEPSTWGLLLAAGAALAGVSRPRLLRRK